MEKFGKLCWDDGGIPENVIAEHYVDYFTKRGAPEGLIASIPEMHAKYQKQLDAKVEADDKIRDKEKARKATHVHWSPTVSTSDNEDRARHRWKALKGMISAVSAMQSIEDRMSKLNASAN